MFIFLIAMIAICLRARDGHFLRSISRLAASGLLFMSFTHIFARRSDRSYLREPSHATFLHPTHRCLFLFSFMGLLSHFRVGACPSRGPLTHVFYILWSRLIAICLRPRDRHFRVLLRPAAVAYQRSHIRPIGSSSYAASHATFLHLHHALPVFHKERAGGVGGS